ncbi:MAG: thermonuclease family protein [Candidatus Gracilibacteria bacterium]|nr:thermonuclease family protein [Candidatus Gracilibacteria bacterium]
MLRKTISACTTFMVLFILGNTTFAEEITINKEIQKIGTEKTCYIDDVDDGDTISLKCGENEIIPNVRIMGINTPDFDRINQIIHCYYDESQNVMEKIRKNERELKVEFYGSDLCKDTYKGCRNVVRLIDKETSIDINKSMIADGYAFSWTDFSIIPKKIRNSYKLAELDAKDNNKGLWGKCEINYFEKGEMDSGVADKMTE